MSVIFGTNSKYIHVVCNTIKLEKLDGIRQITKANVLVIYVVYCGPLLVCSSSIRYTAFNFLLISSYFSETVFLKRIIDCNCFVVLSYQLIKHNIFKRNMIGYIQLMLHHRHRIKLEWTMLVFLVYEITWSVDWKKNTTLSKQFKSQPKITETCKIDTTTHINDRLLSWLDTDTSYKWRG